MPFWYWISVSRFFFWLQTEGFFSRWKETSRAEPINQHFGQSVQPSSSSCCSKRTGLKVGSWLRRSTLDSFVMHRPVRATDVRDAMNQVSLFSLSSSDRWPCDWAVVKASRWVISGVWRWKWRGKRATRDEIRLQPPCVTTAKRPKPQMPQVKRFIISTEAKRSKLNATLFIRRFFPKKAQSHCSRRISDAIASSTKLKLKSDTDCTAPSWCTLIFHPWQIRHFNRHFRHNLHMQMRECDLLSLLPI